MWLNNVINTVLNTVIDERARVEDGEIVEPLVSRPLIFLLDESKGD